MQNPFVPFSGMYQTQLEASRRLAAVLFAGTERIDHVLLDATHNAWSDQLSLVQSIAGIQDSQEGIHPSSLLSKHPEWMLDCQRELISIFSEMQEELSQSMRQYIDEVGQSALVSTSAAGENLGGEIAGFNPVSGIFSAWENAFREATSLTGNSFRKNTDAANAAYSNTEEEPEEASSNAVRSHRAKKHASNARHASHGKRSSR